MTQVDIAARPANFEFYNQSMLAWKVGSTPSERGYLVEVKPGFEETIQIPWMNDVAVELVEPTPAHGTDLRLPAAPGRQKYITLSDPQDRVELIGGEMIDVHHPDEGSEPQAPAFFRVWLLGTRISADLLKDINQGPVNLGPSMSALERNSTLEDFPIKKVVQPDGSHFYRGNPLLAAAYIKYQTKAGPNKLSALLYGLAERIANERCDVEV